jgi:hypothetical protein
MNYVKSITALFTVLLVAVSTLTRAQDVTVNTPSPAVSKFNDIAEMDFNDLSNHQNWMTVGVNNVFAYRPVNSFSMGVGIGVEYRNPGTEVPLSADFRYYFKPAKYASPFLNLYGGYGFIGNYGLNYNNVFGGLNVGINILVTNTVSLQMALGVKVESYSYQANDIFEFRSTDNVTMPFTMGLVF